MSFTFRLTSRLDDYLRDSEEVVRAFYPAVVLSETAADELKLEGTLAEDGNFRYAIFAPFRKIEGDKRFSGTLLARKKYSKRFFKNLIYDLLSTASGVTLPYGSLTGVRPTKLFYELTVAGEDAYRVLQSEFRVAESKAALVRDTVLRQSQVYDFTGDGVDLFINIPFCPTRCAYCSFLTAEYPRIEKKIPAYIGKVKRELQDFKNYLERTQRPLRAVYVGGGTPTSLTADALFEILSEVPAPEKEFTVEAGRPDTLSRAHLDAFRAFGVTRVSVNPQTLSDRVLKNIGRKHTSADFLDAFRMVSEYGFSINTDLIAGLEGETEASFLSGIRKIAELSPDNVTVHTLSLKRGSGLSEAGVGKGEFGGADAMVSAACCVFTEAGYSPYYLYRQKNMTDNLENVGYAKEGKASYYNVDIMEETTDIYGVGAGAMSKKVSRAENRIERLANPKGLEDYLNRTEEILERKRKFFKIRDKCFAFARGGGATCSVR